MAVHRDDIRAEAEATEAPDAVPERGDEQAFATPLTLELERLEERSDGKHASIAVTIAFGGRTVTGLSPSVVVKRRRHGVHRAVLAAIDAVEQLALRRVLFELLDVGRTPADGGTWIRIRLRLMADGEASEIHGRARVRDGVADAAVRAVLDAVSDLLGVQAPRRE